MLESMNAVLERINEIQKRFTPSRNNSLQYELNESNKNFNEVLKDQIAGLGEKEDIDMSVPKIKEISKEYAIKNGIPPSFIDAVIKTESGYNPLAVSNKGASGLMQLMPEVIKDLGIINPFNIEENIQGGISILKRLIEKYDWDLKKVLAAYNAGETAVDKKNGIPPYKETREYVKKVIDAYIQNIE